jgi:ABC-type transport system substrate-binding protein
VFKLRPGVKFHDGSAFDADAVIWNFDKVLKKTRRISTSASPRRSSAAPALGRELSQDRRP